MAASLLKEHWPSNLSPRKGQLEAAKVIAKTLENEEDLVFTAPTGFGKTLTVLVAIKSIEFFPAIWLVRSLKLAKRIASDASLLNIKFFSAAGRKKTCKLVSKLGDAVYLWCKLNKVKCDFYLNLLRKPVKIRSATSWEDLMTRQDICPYYAQDIIISNVELIIQNYHRKIYPAKVIVADEAHNLLIPKEYRVSRNIFITAAAELSAIGETELANEVERIAQLPELLPNLRNYLEDLEVATYDALEHLIQVKGLVVLINILKILSSGGTFHRELGCDYITIYAPPWKPKIKPRIFVSATIPEEMEKILNIETSVRIPIKKRLALVTTWLTTKFEEETITGYKNLIIYLRKKFKKVLLFTTERIASQISPLATHYEPEKLPDNWHGVLLLHTRGRYSEGIDLPSDVVAVLGCPFLPPEVTRNLKRSYEKMGLPGSIAIWVPMVITTLQVIGRSTRSPDAKPLIILADERFLRYEKYFSPYLELRPFNSFHQLSRFT